MNHFTQTAAFKWLASVVAWLATIGLQEISIGLAVFVGVGNLVFLYLNIRVRRIELRRLMRQEAESDLARLDALKERP